ncbi:MAG: cytochrome c biogenesis CcdA family protein, partial [Monoglobales bacterium]
FAGTIGSFFQNYQRIINIFAGILIIIFGLKFMGLLKINIFRGIHQKMDNRNYGFFPSVLMGIIFSLSWTPCVGAFVGSALVYASQQGNPLVGVGMLASYSAGLGIPFLLSAVLIDKFKGKFEKIKHHHYTLHIICGAFLVIVGILMITGKLGGFLELFD